MKIFFQLPFSIFINIILLLLDKFVLFKNNNNHNNKFINSLKVVNKDKYNGCDMRYVTENNLNNSENSLNESKLNNYREIFNKYKIYKLLTNENISINTKLKLIRKEYIFDDNIVPNITKGGLYKHWDL